MKQRENEKVEDLKGNENNTQGEETKMKVTILFCHQHKCIKKKLRCERYDNER